MGEYTGRRRGRAASEPSAQQPEYPYTEESSYQQDYSDQGYAQPQPEAYGYEYGYAAPEYAQEPDYGYHQAPSYEQYPAYEQQPSYEQQAYYQGYPEQGYQEPYYQEDYAQEGYQEGYYQEGYQQEPYYQEAYEEPPRQSRRRGRPAPEEESYAEHGYADPYAAPGYANPYAEPDYPEAPFDTHPSPPPLRTPLPLLAHLPYTGAATVALAVAAFVSAKAVAAVVLPLQLVVAWAVLDLAGFASRRTAVLAALPALAGTVATFKFQPDDAAVPVAAGLGAGFVLVAADAVFRARRRGVEPGSVRALAAAASALLFAGLTGLFLPAAVLHASSVAVGAAVCGFVALLAARHRELAVSRAAVVAIPVTIAALASYAAAILVP